MYSYKLVIKTCGTTTLLNAVVRILELARGVGLDKVRADDGGLLACMARLPLARTLRVRLVRLAAEHTPTPAGGGLLLLPQELLLSRPPALAPPLLLRGGAASRPRRQSAALARATRALALITGPAWMRLTRSFVRLRNQTKFLDSIFSNGAAYWCAQPSAPRALAGACVCT